MSMMIIEDKGQQNGKHEEKHLWFSTHDVELLQSPLPVGDYIIATDRVIDVIKRRKEKLKKMDFLGSFDVSVDTKKDLQEIIGNICGKQHSRFRDECILAKNNDIKLYVLVENKDGVKCIEDLLSWENPRLRIQKWVTTLDGEKRKIPKHKDATRGETLAKAMRTMEEKYGVEFRFCMPEEAGNRILKLLNWENI